MKSMISPTLAVVFTSAFILVGCSSQTSAPADEASDHAEHDHGSHEHGSGHGKADMDSVNAELAKLSSDDAESARMQHSCPVMGELLGTMGAPKKVSVKDRIVWICCDGCKDRLLSDPEKYLAKLQKE